MRIAYEAMCVRVCMLVGSNNVTNNQYLLALLRMNVWPKYLLKNIKHKIIFWKYSKFQKYEQILILSQVVRMSVLFQSIQNKWNWTKGGGWHC